MIRTLLPLVALLCACNRPSADAEPAAGQGGPEGLAHSAAGDGQPGTGPSAPGLGTSADQHRAPQRPGADGPGLPWNSDRLGRPGRQRPEQRQLSITLRSTPPGALAKVDGRTIGRTPTHWSGPATGRPREFTFALPDYATAHYRFVPVTDGVVHGTLKRLMPTDADAGSATE